MLMHFDEKQLNHLTTLFIFIRHVVCFFNHLLLQTS
jgi:hypothetical protein